MKKFNLCVLYFILISALAASAFVSCSDGEQNVSQTDGDSVGYDADEQRADAEQTAEPERVFPHEIQDFGGYTLRVTASQDREGNGLYYEDLEIEEEVGEIYNDSVFRRNILLQEQFNITFSSINVGDVSDSIRRTVNAGSDEYDLALPRLHNAWNLIPFCNDLMELQNFSFSESWHDQNCVENLSVAGRLYITTGDAFTKHYDGIMLLLFNKQIAQENALPDIYSLVSGGRWTFDAMGEMTKAVVRDLNGDGIMDRFDMWGYAQQGDIVGAVINGAGLRYMYKDENDIPYTMANTERMTATIDKFLDFFNDYSWCATRDAGNQHLSAFWVFPDGRALFNGIMLHYIRWQMRDVEHDFGIVPLPKFDEGQERYYASTNAYHTFCFMMPKTVADPEKTAYILDAMGFYGEQMIKPAYYDVSLTRKYTRDEESAEMLDIIFKSTTYDLGLFANFGNIASSVQDLILKGENTYISAYERIEERVATAIERFVTSIE